MDGQENPFSVILSNKFYEVQKYVSVTKHTYSTNIILVSARSSGTSCRRRSRRSCRTRRSRRATYQRQVSREPAQKAVAELKAKGMQVNELTPAELDRMRETDEADRRAFAAEYDPAMVKLFNSELERVHGSRN